MGYSLLVEAEPQDLNYLRERTPTLLDCERCEYRSGRGHVPVLKEVRIAACLPNRFTDLRRRF